MYKRRSPCGEAYRFHNFSHLIHPGILLSHCTSDCPGCKIPQTCIRSDSLSDDGRLKWNKLRPFRALSTEISIESHFQRKNRFQQIELEKRLNWFARHSRHFIAGSNKKEDERGGCVVMWWGRKTENSMTPASIQVWQPAAPISGSPLRNSSAALVHSLLVCLINK